MPNEITSADGGRGVLFAWVTQWPAAAELCARARSIHGLSHASTA
jgi:hypothetical protein